MKHKFIKFVSLMLAFVLIAAVQIYAVTDGTQKKKFSDVIIGNWYYENVMRLTSLGAINGYPDGKFRPQEQITCAEYTKILMMMFGGDIDMKIDTAALKADKTLPPYLRNMTYHWAYPYVYAAYKNGVITAGEFISDFAMDTAIKRDQMVRMTVRAAGVPISPAANVFADTADEYAITAYYLYLVRGYIEGGKRYFKADGLTTRAEAASIIIRALDFTEDRQAFVTDEIAENAALYNLDTTIELIDFFTSKNLTFAKRASFETSVDYVDWTIIYSLAEGMYPEYFYSGGYYTKHYETTNKYVLNFYYSKSAEQLSEELELARKDAALAAGEITAVYTDDESRFKAAHKYLLNACSYDYEGYENDNISDDSYTAYGALIKGKAVCEGYAAAMNLLCDALDIPSYGVTGLAPNSTLRHMWVAVLIDGKMYFSDPTRDDPGGKSAQTMKYALMTPEEAAKYGYIWDSEVVTLDYFHLAY